MKWSILISAIGLLFVFEGIMPFLSPHFYRVIMQQVMLQSDKALRHMGFTSMLIGLIIVTIAHNFF